MRVIIEADVPGKPMTDWMLDNQTRFQLTANHRWSRAIDLRNVKITIPEPDPADDPLGTVRVLDGAHYVVDPYDNWQPLLSVRLDGSRRTVKSAADMAGSTVAPWSIPAEAFGAQESDQPNKPLSWMHDFPDGVNPDEHNNDTFCPCSPNVEPRGEIVTVVHKPLPVYHIADLRVFMADEEPPEDVTVVVDTGSKSAKFLIRGGLNGRAWAWSTQPRIAVFDGQKWQSWRDAAELARGELREYRSVDGSE